MILASSEAVPWSISVCPQNGFLTEETAIRNAYAQRKTAHPLTGGMPLGGCL
jgi:hypothetical protein